MRFCYAYAKNLNTDIIDINSNISPKKPYKNEMEGVLLPQVLVLMSE